MDMCKLLKHSPPPADDDDPPLALRKAKSVGKSAENFLSSAFNLVQ